MTNPNTAIPWEQKISPTQPWLWRDLYDPDQLAKLHQDFLAMLGHEAPEMYRQLQDYYTHHEAWEPRARSELIIACASWVGRYIERLFGITTQANILQRTLLDLQCIPRLRREFVKKRKITTHMASMRPNSASHDLGANDAYLLLAEFALEEAEQCLGLETPGHPELRFARAALFWVDIDDKARRVAQGGGMAWTEKDSQILTRLRDRLTVGKMDNHSNEDLSLLDDVMTALSHHYAQHADETWASRWDAHKINPDNLVTLRRTAGTNAAESLETASEHRRERVEPFALTDSRGSAAEVAVQVDYCVICHPREKDSCRKGIHNEKGLKVNALNVPLEGCPLDEKISETHALQAQGEAIGALATIIIDNPMCPGTGHRICNECMRACIFQVQDPVNIPQVETHVLTNVLELPWGFEIYSLLTRWNPLNAKRPYALPYNGANVLVVGLGPAGYTLAHYLANEGCGVVGIDGLKIEEMDDPGPVHDISTLRKPLQKRVVTGFGGVSEYGITNRWDKNFLDIIYLALCRKPHLSFYSGIRFGGTVTVEDSWRLGFDHIALCTGAGRPTLIPMAHAMPQGMRMASDFLMNLHLAAPYRSESLANIEVHLPAWVIGGGLTAIDTATELQAYYIAQAEKVYVECQAPGGQAVRECYAVGTVTRDRLELLFAHGEQISKERARAAHDNTTPKLSELVRTWGGVHIAYRKRLQDSPAYRLNHEEVQKAFEEGIRYYENMTPLEACSDAHGFLESMVFDYKGETITMPARTVCIAAGTSPNTSYEREYPGTFKVGDFGFFDQGSENHPFFTTYRSSDFPEHRVSFFGDNHPKYAGSVVKAMASAKDGYSFVVEQLNRRPNTERYAERSSERAGEDANKTSCEISCETPYEASWAAFTAQLDNQWRATVEGVNVLAPGIVEVVIRAPAAANHFRPGQFYRLQNFAGRTLHASRLMEPLAMTGAWVDVSKGLVSVIALEIGASSKLCRHLHIGESVVLMGPTGSPTEITSQQTVLLVGGGLGNAVLFSIAAAFKAANCRVIYFAGYRKAEDLFKRDAIESASDQVIWATDVSPAITPKRDQDRSFVGNIVNALLAFAEGTLGETVAPLSAVQRIIAIGSDRMMRAVKEARHGVLSPFLNPEHIAIGSINSPMQCMMKEICAQCLQRHVDPISGEETFVYSCVNQDQLLDVVDFEFLARRLGQNRILETLTDATLR